MTRHSLIKATLAASLILLTSVLSVRALVVDALSFALEGAEKIVSDEGGFSLRKDFWQGVSDSGEGHAIKHHLIAGNAYWFWVGTDSDDVTMAIAIYDKKGRLVSDDKKVKRGKNWIGIPVEVPKSGTYYIAFKITTKDQTEAHWAVAYAFK